MIDDEASARAWVAALPECDADALARLQRLADLLAQENTRQNLVSRPSLDRVWQRHIADSAQLLVDVPRGTQTWLDIGSGAGFPGLVIACLRPRCRITLTEPRKRRAAWLETAASALELNNAVVLARLVQHLPEGKFAVISARAVAPLADLMTLSARFSTSATLWRLPKGRNAQQELRDLRGWDHLFHVEQSLTDSDAGIIVGTLRGRKGAKP